MGSAMSRCQMRYLLHMQALIGSLLGKARTSSIRDPDPGGPAIGFEFDTSQSLFLWNMAKQLPVFICIVIRVATHSLGP